MQRASNSLRSTCRLCESIRRPSVSHANTPKNSLRSVLPGWERNFCNGQIFTTPLLDFLHPPIVQEAISYSKRLDRHVRKYSKDQDNDDDFPSFQGWSASELER